MNDQPERPNNIYIRFVKDEIKKIKDQNKEKSHIEIIQIIGKLFKEIS